MVYKSLFVEPSKSICPQNSVELYNFKFKYFSIYPSLNKEVYLWNVDVFSSNVSLGTQ